MIYSVGKKIEMIILTKTETKNIISALDSYIFYLESKRNFNKYNNNNTQEKFRVTRINKLKKIVKKIQQRRKRKEEN